MKAGLKSEIWSYPTLHFTIVFFVEQSDKIMEYLEWPYQNIYGDQTIIGNKTRIGAYVEIGNAVIGKNCLIEAFCYIPKGVTIEDNVFVGPRVTFLNDKYPPSYGVHWCSTLVKKGAVIGGGAIILPGVVIGRQAIIGAGAVVTKDVPERETWVGNPAKKI